MGKNKWRAKGVNVTKRFLQPPSVVDVIAVSIGPQLVVQVTEEELSPTQGSEAAFALQREGKLDKSMKLCHNWRHGACHSYAACTFAHVTNYFDVARPGLTSVRDSCPGAVSQQSSGNLSEGVKTACEAVPTVNPNSTKQQISKPNTPKDPRQHQSPTTSNSPSPSNFPSNTRSSGVSWLQRLGAASSKRQSASIDRRSSGGGLPLKANWGAPSRGVADHNKRKGVAEFVDLDAAMASVDRDHRNGWQKAAPTPQLEQQQPQKQQHVSAAAAKRPDARMSGGPPAAPPTLAPHTEFQGTDPAPAAVASLDFEFGEPVSVTHRGRASDPLGSFVADAEDLAFRWPAAAADRVISFQDSSDDGSRADPLRWLSSPALGHTSHIPAPGCSPVWSVGKSDLLRQLVGTDDDENADPGCSEGRAASLIPAAGQPAPPLDSCSRICSDTLPMHHCSIEQLMSLLTGDE